MNEGFLDKGKLYDKVELFIIFQVVYKKIIILFANYCCSEFIKNR